MEETLYALAIIINTFMWPAVLGALFSCLFLYWIMDGWARDKYFWFIYYPHLKLGQAWRRRRVRDEKINEIHAILTKNNGIPTVFVQHLNVEKAENVYEAVQKESVA